jgi:hypothetical protein
MITTWKGGSECGFEQKNCSKNIEICTILEFCNGISDGVDITCLKYTLARERNGTGAGAATPRTLRTLKDIWVYNTN